MGEKSIMVDEVIVKSTGEVVKRTLTADEETAWNNRQPSNAYKLEAIRPVSYTHLTLPTKRIV